MVKPMPFWKIYLYKRELSKISGDVKIYYNRYLTTSYCIPPNKVVLPFIEPLDLEDLKLLYNHEILHLKKTGKLKVELNDASYTHTLNILEDWYVNQYLDINKIKRIYRKLNSPFVGIIPHLKKEEALREIKKMKNIGILKDDYSDEEIYEVFMEAFEKRKNYSQIQDFYEDNMDFLREKYFPLFNIDNTMVSDGPCEYEDYYDLPDWDMKKEFDKIIKRLIHVSPEEVYYQSFNGRKLNNRFIYDDLYIYPFKERKDIISINEPKVCVIVDMSGSMDSFERITKALVMSILQNIDKSVAILQNEFCTKITTIPDIIVKFPCTGNDSFNVLPHKTDIWKNCDILLIVTDLIISDEELEGLNKIIKESKARAKYCLCVNAEKYEEENINCRKFLCSTKEGFIEAIKRISLNM